jgi:hypothetical protein
MGDIALVEHNDALMGACDPPSERRPHETAADHRHIELDRHGAYIGDPRR